MNLNDTQMQLAAASTALPEPRKAEVLQHLNSMPPDRFNQVTSILLDAAGADGDFARDVFLKVAPLERHDAPANKSMQIPNQ